MPKLAKVSKPPVALEVNSLQTAEASLLQSSSTPPQHFEDPEHSMLIGRWQHSNGLGQGRASSNRPCLPAFAQVSPLSPAGLQLSGNLLQLSLLFQRQQG